MARGELFNNGNKVHAVKIAVKEAVGKQVAEVVQNLGEVTPDPDHPVISTEGGQGDVYRVFFQGKPYALKWYVEDEDGNKSVIGDSLYNNMAAIHGEAKRPSDKFMWPLYMVTADGTDKGTDFGYLMELLPEGYHDLFDYNRNGDDPLWVQFSSEAMMFKTAINIARRMKEIHDKGFAFLDLNARNIAVHEKTGEVLVVDNDNATYADTDIISSVLGTPGYMAPEIYTENKKPSTTTDYYSLAVVLYEMFCGSHPMDGKRWAEVPFSDDPKVQNRFYYEDPIFQFDDSGANPPVKGFGGNAITRYKLLPDELKYEFKWIFTKGVKDPGKRQTEVKWIHTLARCRDLLVRIYNYDIKEYQGYFVRLQEPKKLAPGMFVLKLSKDDRELANKDLPVYPGKAFYKFSLTDVFRDANEIFAGIEMMQDRWGMYLNNMSEDVWSYIVPVNGQWGEWKKLRPGEKTEVVLNMYIAFDEHYKGQIIDPRN